MPTTPFVTRDAGVVIFLATHNLLPRHYEYDALDRRVVFTFDRTEESSALLADYQRARRVLDSLIRMARERHSVEAMV